MYPRLALNSIYSQNDLEFCLPPFKYKVTGACHHAQFYVVLGFNLRALGTLSKYSEN